MEIKSLLADIMKEKGITIRNLEDGTGLAPQTIIRARKNGEENIEACSLRTLARIAQCLNVSIKDLFEE